MLKCAPVLIQTPIIIPKNSKRLKSEEEVLEGEITNLPLPTLDADLLLGLGHNRPRSF
jgi:hypothetical protein